MGGANIEQLADQVRRAPALLCGVEDDGSEDVVTKIGPWKKGRLLAEQDLSTLRTEWLEHGSSAARALAQLRKNMAP